MMIETVVIAESKEDLEQALVVAQTPSDLREEKSDKFQELKHAAETLAKSAGENPTTYFLIQALDYMIKLVTQQLSTRMELKYLQAQITRLKGRYERKTLQDEDAKEELNDIKKRLNEITRASAIGLIGSFLGLGAGTWCIIYGGTTAFFIGGILVVIVAGVVVLFAATHIMQAQAMIADLNTILVTCT